MQRINRTGIIAFTAIIKMGELFFLGKSSPKPLQKPACRKENPEKAYYNCHLDITIPYEELGKISVFKKDGTEIKLIEDGQFVLPGTEVLNEPLAQ